MPTPRPSSPASLSTTNAVALAALGCWLVDASGDVPDLTGAQPDLHLTATTLPYSTTGVLGGHLTGNSSGIASSHPITTISNYPFVIGAVFATAGAKTGGSGIDNIAVLGDSANTSGVIFMNLFVDDGSNTTTGHLTVLIRAAAFGTVQTIDLGAVDDGALHCCFLTFEFGGINPRLHASLDGTTTITGMSGETFDGSSTFTWLSLLSTQNVNGPSSPASSNMLAALLYYSQTVLADSDYDAVSGDSWVLLESSSAPSQKAYPVSDDSTGSWQAKGPSTETRRNLLTYTDDVSAGSWTNIGCTTPDATSLTEDTNFSNHYISQNVSLTSGLDYSLSVDVKPEGRAGAQVQVGNLGSPDGAGSFHLSGSGSIGGSTGTTSIDPADADGYYRCKVSFTAVSTVSHPIIVAAEDGSFATAYTGNGTRSLRVRRIQFEQASLPSDYQQILTTDPPYAVVSSPVYPATADGSTGTPNDSTYGFVLLPGIPYWFKFGTTTAPVDFTGTGFSLRGLSPQLRSLQIDIYQGYLGTLIATRTINLTASVAQTDVTLTAPEIALITDLSDIHGRMVGL